jgi:hypothetical protein
MLYHKLILIKRVLSQITSRKVGKNAKENERREIIWGVTLVIGYWIHSENIKVAFMAL